MKIFIAVSISVFALLGGFYLMGGNVFILWNPKELGLISACAFSSFFLSSDKTTISHLSYDLKSSMMGGRYNKPLVFDMIIATYNVLIRHRREGSAVFEGVISDPDGSSMMGNSVFFEKYPNIRQVFIDYFRMYLMDTTRVNEYIASMHHDYKQYAKEKKSATDLLAVTAEATPGLGIVVAVLGIIRALGAIDGPMSVLGHMIAEALVGTMFGVWVCYSALAPLAAHLANHSESDIMIREFVVTVLSSHLMGISPIISIELGRKVLPDNLRPLFEELEEATIGGGGNKG